MASYGASKKGIIKGPKILHHVEIHKAANGGHVVEHHFTSGEHAPEQHVFGKGEGKAMMAHVGQAVGADLNAEPEAEDLAKAEGNDKAEIDA